MGAALEGNDAASSIRRQDNRFADDGSTRPENERLRVWGQVASGLSVEALRLMSPRLPGKNLKSPAQSCMAAAAPSVTTDKNLLMLLSLIDRSGVLSMRSRLRIAAGLLTLLSLSHVTFAQAPAKPRPGELPTDPQGKPLNFDFETGSLKDWTAEGDAFEKQPVRGDTVARRRGDMQSNHAGEFWVGTYEVNGDAPQGTLTSVPFEVRQPWASFLIAGGSEPTSCVEILQKDGGKLIVRASGSNTEDLRPVAVDLTKHVGQEIVVRLVDKSSGGWGHINFDDFRFHAEKPNYPQPEAPLQADVFAHSGLSPEEAAKAMTVPEGFSVSLFAGEPDVQQPIAMALDDRGRLWVAEAYSYPIRVPEDQARDRILIFEDVDGDGKFDSRKVFADNLNLVSGLAVGFGGVWVGACRTSCLFRTRTATTNRTGRQRCCSTAGATTTRTKR